MESAGNPSSVELQAWTTSALAADDTRLQGPRRKKPAGAGVVSRQQGQQGC